MDGGSSRGWIWTLLKPVWPTFREVMAISLFVNILAIAVPVFVLQVYDRVVFHAGMSTLQGLVIGMACALVFDFILRQARSRILQTIALRVDVTLGRLLFDKVMAVPLPVLERRPAAYWQALFRDVETVRNTLSGASALLITDLPFAVLFLAVAFVIATPVAWVLLVFGILFMAVAWRSGAAMGAASVTERESGLARDGLIAEIIAARTTIKALALEQAVRPLWEGRHAATIERAATRGATSDGYVNLGITMTLLTSVTLTTVGALAIMEQQLTIGALIATNMLSGRMLGPFNQLVLQWRAYAAFRQAVARLGELFAIPSERQSSAVRLQRPSGRLVLEQVTFNYGLDAIPVIDNLSLGIDGPGLHALVGRNGCGKTTLLKLAQGLYRPASGRVLLDGADVNQFSRAELAEWIGYLPQESVLFAGSIRDNIVQRLPDSTDDLVLRAAQVAGVHGFIVDLPDGYATDIGEAGGRLSGGQRQRIALARAILGDPPLLLLDEPSSSLDRQGEIELRDALQALARDRTVVVVTHSPILLAACDTLIALEKGKVALAGPARDLLPRLFGSAARPALRREPA